MLKKFCHWFFGLVFVSGFIVALAISDSSELNVMEWTTKLKFGILAASLMFGGFIGLRLSDWEYLT